jgi:CPA2 family monovalent cation:H+ antiporter-2
VAASLAQIGEFSFILAGLGVALGLLPSGGRDLVLAGALLSITFNPLVFAGLDRLTAWLRGRPELMARLERSGGEDLSALPEGDEVGPRDHAIIVGYGRVGSVVGKGLEDQGLPVVVVDVDRRRVEELRGRGVAAVYGDASTPGVLEAARADRARLVVIATPEGFQTRRTIELARRLNPAIDIAVRTQSEAEVAYLERQGVGLAILGVRELAFGLLDHALRSLGTPEEKAKLLVQNLRVSGEGGAFERRPAEPSRGVPELRQHRDPEDGLRSDALS